jgi:hypothetical protein
VFVEQKDVTLYKLSELEKDLNELEQEIAQLIKIEEERISQEKEINIIFSFRFFYNFSKILELIQKKFKNFKIKIKLKKLYFIQYGVKVLKNLKNKKK